MPRAGAGVFLDSSASHKPKRVWGNREKLSGESPVGLRPTTFVGWAHDYCLCFCQVLQVEGAGWGLGVAGGRMGEDIPDRYRHRIASPSITCLIITGHTHSCIVMSTKMKVPFMPKQPLAATERKLRKISGTKTQGGISPVQRMPGKIKLNDPEQIHQIIFDPSLEPG